MPETVRRIRPTPIDTYLANPHKGCCTFQRFNGDPLYATQQWSEQGPLTFPARVHPGVTPGYLPSTVSYCRWYWSTLEPESGRYDFSMIEQALATAHARGQTLAIRLMPYGQGSDIGVPPWYVKRFGLGKNGQPDHDSPEYFEHFGNFIREAGRKFAADPRLETVDVVYFGWWGEGDGVIGEAQCVRFADLYRESFPDVPRLGMIAGVQMRVALATGTGWRCDCFGDVKTPGNHEVLKEHSWCHMYDDYPREIAANHATETWRTAPVHFETCWAPMKWYQEQHDIEFLIQQGFKMHGTYFMPKSCALPPAWSDALWRFSRGLGYRYILRHARLESPARLGTGTFHLNAWIENVGIAPLYHKYDVVIRMRQRDRQSLVRLPGIDVRTWLPGDTIIDQDVPMPAGIRPGWVDLGIGLVRPGAEVAGVRFAVKEAYGDGYASLGGIEVD